MDLEKSALPSKTRKFTNPSFGNGSSYEEIDISQDETSMDNNNAEVVLEVNAPKSKVVGIDKDIVFIEELVEMDTAKDEKQDSDTNFFVIEPDEVVASKDSSADDIDNDIVELETYTPKDGKEDTNVNVIVIEPDEVYAYAGCSNIAKHIVELEADSPRVDRSDSKDFLEDEGTDAFNVGGETSTLQLNIIDESGTFKNESENADKDIIVEQLEADVITFSEDKSNDEVLNVISAELEIEEIISSQNKSDNSYANVTLEECNEVDKTIFKDSENDPSVPKSINVPEEVPIETPNDVINENTYKITEREEDMEVIYDNCSYSTHKIDYDFSHTPYQITGSWKEFASKTKHNFTRGCKWAPDGSCILTCSDDNILRIFNLPQQLWDFSQWADISEMEAVVKISEGELIYDYCWYPLMNSADAATCCLASISRKSTVHLWDGFTGELRCTYRTFNHLDEIATPHSLSFDSDGQRLFCGFEKFIRIFNVDSPGRNFEERNVFAKKSGQCGIISCFAFTPTDKNISAAGSYQKTIGIYSEPDGELQCLLEGQKGGVTQLQFSPDGTYLYSGGRKDPEILCWDLRNLGTVLFSLRRSCTTNQRMYFDVSKCGNYVVSGNQNGVVSIWDVSKEPKIVSEEEFPVLEPIQFFLAHDDCVNGVSLHPTYPLMCTTSGQRKFPALLDEEEEDIFSPKIDKWDNSLRLWWLGKSN